MKRVRLLAFAFLGCLILPLCGETETRTPVPEALRGVWESDNRFVEFTENTMRIVLKPYYRFVYEPFPPLASAGLSRSPHVPAEGVYSFSLRYPRDKKVYPVTVARAGDALFLNFMVRLPIPPAAGEQPAGATSFGTEQPSGATSFGSEQPAGATSFGTEQPADAGKTVADEALAAALDGVWLPSGVVSALRLYPVDPADDFFMMVFDGTRYFRVRYWKTDARERDIDGRFTGKNGKEYRLPKFFRIDGTLYTCITSTGKIIRNFEEGSVGIETGTLRFEPDRVVFTGTEAAYRHPVPYTLDGDVLAFGEPYLVRSIVTDLDATITEHNAKRRPPRKPIFDFMELDFHWDEVERLRGNILDR